MVGHTGDREAAILGVQAVDLQLGRLLEAARAAGAIVIITADHGNADEMYERTKSGDIARDPATGRPRAKTSHTLNPVPFVVVDAEAPERWRLRTDLPEAGLANFAATALRLLGYEAPEGYEGSLLA